LRQRNQVRYGPSDIVNPSLFIFSVLCGSGFIIIAKHLHFEAWVITSGPIVIMMLYAIVIFILPRFRLRFDQVGDNIYYMGFLFTLTSLGVSLYQFKLTSGAEQIIQNFGIAVGSTIAGVALRVVFIQMRRDPIEVENSARLELAEASRRVRRELDDTVLELAQFRRSTEQAILDGFSEVRAAMTQSNEQVVRELQSLVERSAKPFEEAASASASALDALRVQIETRLQEATLRVSDQQSKLGDTVAQIAEAASNLAKSLSEIQMPDRLVEVQLSGPIEKISAAIDKLATQVADWSSATGPHQAVPEVRRHEPRSRSSGSDSELVDAVTQALTEAVARERSTDPGRRA